MSSDSDLSTQDLAQPGGARGEDRSTSDRRDDPAGGGVQTPGAQGERRAESAGAGGEQGVDVDGNVVAGEPTQRRDTVGSDQDDRTSVGGATREDRTSAGASSGGGTDTSAGNGDVALLDSADQDRFRQRWSDVQARFVDDPQGAVQTADGLVAELMQSMAQGFSDHKGRLEAQWQQGGAPDTEELRQALQRYRSFFHRLLST